MNILKKLELTYKKIYYQYKLMKIDCVLTSVNTNLKYITFIPYFIKSWNKLYPNIEIIIILISNEIPEEYKIYSKNIILYKPIENISTAFISQYIRILYPAVLNFENGILITDIDMIPMNNSYFTKTIKSYDEDVFINYRGNVKNKEEYYICYNIAKNTIWSEIFNIKNINEINTRIQNSYNLNYEGRGKCGWFKDQEDLYFYLKKWNKKTNRFILLNDKDTKYNRLCRSYLRKKGIFNKNKIDILKNIIEKNKYTDYHCLTPFYKYKEINEIIYNII